ncbi:hypothetical protein [Neobacillus jeddahensis]|uniref:hypothetical protein n=1 Tax=Neobacillus jeddahensis TaxID=1461580 RepID=UPI0006941298|nr:hypothetical protein [Neobacillus jeddahensis]
MADHNETENEVLNETELEVVEHTETNAELEAKATVKKDEGTGIEDKGTIEAEIEQEDHQQLSGLDVLWRNFFDELDEWVKRADFRDEMFLKEAKLFAESVQRNQGNMIEVAAQFYQEFSAWEKMARDEFLMSTTSLQHFFPLRSYEEINAQIDQIQEKTLTVLATPCQKIASSLSVDKYVDMIDQYIVLRKKARVQYVKTIKQAGNLLYENQKGFVNVVARQIKTLFFPLNKYLETRGEFTKS